MNQHSHIFIGLLLGCLLLVSCNSGISGQKYAQKFCACADDFSKAAIQLKAGTIDEATFKKIETDFSTCIGEEDPLEALKDKPEQLTQFKAEFLTELEKQCPDIARNMGY